MKKNVIIPNGPYRADWESLKAYTPPDWYFDGKFGIFIHWGVYSVPAFGNEWYPRKMYDRTTQEFEHHREVFGDHAKFGYKDFIPMFTAEKFDADEWANLFKDSGARFVVPVAEHHDGFAMYDCSCSEWCAARMGPKRDVIGELAEAVRRQWLVFGVSSHRAEHWWFMDEGMKFDSDVRDPDFADFYGPAQPKDSQPNEEFLDDWLFRACELVDKYQPQLVWFDWWIEQPTFREHLKRFAAYYYNRGIEWNRGVAINFKNDAFPKDAAVFDVERGQLDAINPHFWQTDTSTAKNSWGYIDGLDYKQTGDIICDLVDIVSKNGAFLLNIGPRSDGTISSEDRKILEEIGAWMRINGEAIYDTRPWVVYGEGPTRIESGSFTDTKRKPFTERDIRFTTKGSTLYAVVLARAEKPEVLVRSLASDLRLCDREITGVSILGSERPLRWKLLSTGLRVTLPEQPICDHAYVLKIERA